MQVGSNILAPVSRWPAKTKQIAVVLAIAGLGVGGLLAELAMRGMGVMLLSGAVFGGVAVRLAAKGQASRGEMRRLQACIERIGEGDLGADGAAAACPEFVPLFDAVTLMAQRTKQTIDGLHEVAQRDTLTQLHNRSSFERAVERQLKECAGDCAILFIDLDGFKSVNDMLGHNFGDRLLQAASDRLKLATRLDELVDARTGVSGDRPGSVTLARFGGDEFVVFLSGLGSETNTCKVAARILRVLSEPFELGLHMASVSASIGIALADQHGDTYAKLLRAADTAMYHAKRSGRNRLEVYSAALDEDLLRLAEEEQELREALARGEFELYYQPLFNCQTLVPSSAEALLRWRHPRRGMVLPGEFIPLAERANLMNAIGEWVIGEAVRCIAGFAAADRPLRIAVNVSPNQLQTLEFIAIVKASLQRYDAPPHLLELEITEDVAMHDVELAADRLARVTRLGVSVAIDDFGTGYSNLARLIDMPFSRLKLDRSLVQNLTLRPEARVLAQTIIAMANSLGLHSVAEGVETREQLELLRAMGCDEVQGFLLARPMGHADLAQMLADPAVSYGVSPEFTKAA